MYLRNKEKEQEMIRKPSTEVIINLDGEMGNAFALMAKASQLAKALDMDAKAIVDDMQNAGSYQNLIKVFYKNFGSVIIVETKNQELLDVCKQLEVV
tara:strand:- start:64 stop:354 length:291 start_codon:yes stop_codon:yes gene_type:complete